MLQKAPFLMGVDHAHGLKIGIDDHRAHKFHAALLQVGGDGVGKGGARFAFFLHDLFICPVPEVG